MAEVVTSESYGTANRVDNGKAIWGAVGIYLAFGVGLALLALAAAAFVAGDPTADPTSGSALVTSLAVGVLPLIAAPILAVVAGVWTGIALRETGSASWTAAVGTLVGAIVMFIVVAIGLWLGAAIAGFPEVDTTQGATQNLQFDNPADLQFFFSVVGIVYLIAHLVIAAIAGAIVGGILPRFRGAVVAEERVEPGPTRI